MLCQNYCGNLHLLIKQANSEKLYTKLVMLTNVGLHAYLKILQIFLPLLMILGVADC